MLLIPIQFNIHLNPSFVRLDLLVPKSLLVVVAFIISEMHNPISCHCLIFFLSTLLFISLASSRSLQILSETDNANANEIEKPLSFLSFDWSTNTNNNHPVSLVGNAALTDSAVRLTRPISAIIYKHKPIHFVGSSKPPVFSTHFSFSFSNIPGNDTELSFFLAPSEIDSSSVLQLGIPPNSISVQLVSLIESDNKSESYIKIKVGGHLVAQSAGLSNTNSIKTHDGEKLNCWIEYNGVSKRMQVRVSKSTEDSISGMMSALLSYPVDLTELLFKHKYFASLRYSCNNLDESVSIYSWSFSVGHAMMHSEPLDPRSFVVKSTEDHNPVNHERVVHYRYWGFVLIMSVVCAACGALMMWYTIVSRWKAESLEVSMHPIDTGYEKILMFEGGNVKGYLELEDME